MTFGVELRNFRLFEGQLIKLRINVDHRIEHRFRFQRQIDGIFILTKRVQFVLCVIQTCAHFRELFGEEGQAFRRFSRLAFDVLLKVVAGNAVENFADLIFIFTGKGHAQDTRVLAIFGDRQVILQIVDHPQGGEFGDGKLAAFLRLNSAHLHADAIFCQHLSHFTARAEACVAGQLILLRP